jgi:hypothetical protein
MTANIVGGGTGGRLSLAALAASRYYEPVALADLQLEVRRALQKTSPALKTFADFREMFRACPTDLVCVSTWHLENLLPMIVSGELDYSIPDTSLSALEICEAAYLSGRHGIEIKFPLDRIALPGPNDWQPGDPYLGQGGGRDGRKLS